MGENKILNAVLLTVLIIGVILVSMCVQRDSGTGFSDFTLPIQPPENFVLKNSKLTLEPGKMIASAVGVKNDDPDNRSLYYTVNFKAVLTDTGKPLEEISKWILFNEDYTPVSPGDIVFVDFVVSVPSDAVSGDYLFETYACYGETPGQAGESGDCDANSANLWAANQFILTVVG